MRKLRVFGMWNNQDELDICYGVRDYKTWSNHCLGFTCVG